MSELETHVRQLNNKLDERDQRFASVIAINQELQNEVEGKTKALRRMMFDANRPS